MGETGVGITSEDQIDMNTPNAFTNKWSMYLQTPKLCLCEAHIVAIVAIKGTFPWLFEMKALISERPNLVPVGLGNNDAPIDMSDFLANAGDNDDDTDRAWGSEKLFGDELGGDGGVNEEVSSGGGFELDDDDEEVVVPTKRKGKDAEKKTAARPGLSKPADIQSNTKKHRMVDRFSEQVKAEADTAQKAFELKKARVEATKAKDLARIHAQADIKREKLRLRVRLEEKRMELELKKAQLAFPTHSLPGFSSAFSPALPSFPAGIGQVPDHSTSLDSMTDSYKSASIEFPPTLLPLRPGPSMAHASTGAGPSHVPNLPDLSDHSASASRSTSKGYKSSEAASESFGSVGSIYDSFHFGDT
jgi:hypothetical protein